MSVSSKTATEVFESLNGFDEIAVKKLFGETMNALAADDQATTFLRALTFIDFRRGGQNDHAAWESAMNLPIGEVRAYFASDSEDSGKGDTQPESEPTT